MSIFICWTSLRHEHDAEHDDDHGGLILGNYVQADARFRGFEIEVGFAVALESGTIRVKLARDQTIANFDNGGSVPRIMPSRNLLEINGDFAKFDATLSYQNVGASAAHCAKRVADRRLQRPEV